MLNPASQGLAFPLYIILDIDQLLNSWVESERLLSWQVNKSDEKELRNRSWELRELESGQQRHPASNSSIAKQQGTVRGAVSCTRTHCPTVRGNETADLEWINDLLCYPSYSQNRMGCVYLMVKYYFRTLAHQGDLEARVKVMTLDVHFVISYCIIMYIITCTYKQPNLVSIICKYSTKKWPQTSAGNPFYWEYNFTFTNWTDLYL